MKIYKVTCNEVAKDPIHGISSSYKAPRNERWVEYYSTKFAADTKAKVCLEAAITLIGPFPQVEFIVTELDVKE